MVADEERRAVEPVVPVVDWLEADWALGVRKKDCVERLPPNLESAPSSDAIRLIDVIWIEGDQDDVAAATRAILANPLTAGGRA